MQVRRCCRCGKTHPLTKEFFHVSRKEKTGHEYCCKVCKNAKQKAKCLEKYLSSEKYHIKVKEEKTGLRVCKTCGVEKVLTLFALNTRVLVDGTRNQYRKPECNACRQFKRNGGRPSKPKIRPSQILVEVDGETRKQCSTCRESKEVKAFHKSISSVTGFSHICGKCLRASKNADYSRDPIKANAIKRAWDARNVEKVREQEKIRHQRYYAKPEKKAQREEWYRKWVLRNPEKIKATSKKRAGEITDAYVEHLLCSGGGGKRIPKAQWPEIPQELIEVKRMHLKLQRAINEKDRGRKI